MMLEKFFSSLKVPEESKSGYYELSKPVAQRIRDAIYDMLKARGFTRFPEILQLKNSDPLMTLMYREAQTPEVAKILEKEGDELPSEWSEYKTLKSSGIALSDKNAILLHHRLTEETHILDSCDDMDVIKGVTAHEIGHLLDPEKPNLLDLKNLNNKRELKADRFAHFLTQNPEPLAMFLASRAEKNRQDERQAMLSFSVKDKMTALGTCLERAIFCGSIKERLKNIRKPLTKEEISEFTSAIRAYNNESSASERSR